MYTFHKLHVHVFLIMIGLEVRHWSYAIPLTKTTMRQKLQFNTVSTSNCVSKYKNGGYVSYLFMRIDWFMLSIFDFWSIWTHVLVGQNRMQNLSTYCQKSNFEESRNLPSSLNMKCTYGKTSKTASNSNGFKDKNTFVNEKVHAGNQIDDVFQIKEHCTIDIDVTELGKVIEGNKKNDDSGFKKEYAVSIMIKPMLGKICENGGIPFLRKKADSTFSI